MFYTARVFRRRLRVFVELENVAVLDEDDVFVVVASDVVLDKFLLTEQHSVFAVDRDDEFRLCGLDHDLDVVLRRVAGDVHKAAFFFNDIGSAFVEMADQAADVFFVAGNDAGRKHDGVAFFDLHAFVCAGCQVPQCRPHFALRTSDEITDLVVIERTRASPRSIIVSLRDLQQALFSRDLNILLHRAAEHTDLSAKLMRDVKDDLQTMQRRRERRNDQAGLRFARISLQKPESRPFPTACGPERSRLSNRTAKRERLRRRYGRAFRDRMAYRSRACRRSCNRPCE